MKTLDSPRIGKLHNIVYFLSPFGQCARGLVIPRDPETEAQRLMRSIMGCCSSEWTHRLTEEQRKLWNAAALAVASAPSLSQYSHLSGHQMYIKLNATLRCISQPAQLTPPAPVVFTPNGVTGLSIINTAETGVRLLLDVGTLTEDVMVYGQPPCNAGRMKRRRVYYLGLAGPAINGQVDITDRYTAKFGTPEPGKKVFVVTCQTRNGWQAVEHEFSAIVPPLPAAKTQQAKTALPGARPSPAAATSESTAAKGISNAPETSLTAAPEDGHAPKTAEPPQASSPRTVAIPAQFPAMYKRSTRKARHEHRGRKQEQVLSSPCAALVHAVRMAMNWLGMMGRRA